MDDLYEDFENYEFDDIKIVSELKSENQQLKCKLEEYASTLASLQKDFDKLSAEYKKLEINYSSLLKTAKAEIERKSQMITNLNIEKDKLVIKALQNRGRPQYWKNSFGNKQQGKKPLAKEEDLAKKDKDATVPNTIDNNVFRTIHHERQEKYKKTVCPLDPGLKDDTNINQESKINDVKGDKEKTKNAPDRNKDSDLDVVNNVPVTSAGEDKILPGPSCKENLDSKDNELKHKRINAHKYENNKSRANNSDVFSKGAVPSTDQILDPGLKDYSNHKENESKKFNAYKERENIENDIRKSKERHSDVFSTVAMASKDQTILLDPTLKDNLHVRDNFSTSKKNDLYRDKANRNDIKKSKDHLNDFSNFDNASSAVKIRNRRKSMPLLNRGDIQFSSDEDQDDILKDPRSRRRTPVRDDRIYCSKYRDGRNDFERKVPDLIRMRDRNTRNYDSSRDNYRKSNSWYRDSDRYRTRDNNRDKYESRQRSSIYYSPDPAYNIGEYNNRHRESYERPHTFDYVRNRTLVSPPPEKYNQYRRSREFDGQGYQSEVIHPMKHKLHDVLEEPICKRMRSESTNKPPDKHLFAHDRLVEASSGSTSKPSELSYLSLQSPDYVHSENYSPTNQIKEIKDTAETKLDDPRLKSKKYVVNTHSNKIVLSTVVGRAIDIKAIDTTNWNMKKDEILHEMPALLREKPQISEDLVKDIYMDIDNPISNLSLESGEIELEDKGLGIVNERKGNIKFNIVHENNERVPNYDETHDRNEITKKEASNVIDNEQETCPTVVTENYRIPKIKKSKATKALEEDSTKSTKAKRDSTKQAHKTRNKKGKRDVEKKLKPESNDSNFNFFSDTMNPCKNESPKLVDIKRRENSPEKPIISEKYTVEGDLELSDETCDYVEDSAQIKCDEENNIHFSERNNDIIIGSINTDSNIEGATDKSECTVLKHRIDKPCEKKHFNISHGGHEVETKESTNTVYKEQKSKDIKSKLCDLFGDTSSLITLDDLGIVVPTTAKENLNEYTPLFENTQDAVDLNVKEMEKVQTRSMKLKSDKNVPNKADKMITLGSMENSYRNSSERERQKLNDEKDSSVSHIFENVNVNPDDKTVVKTVIISSGIQNNCNSGGGMHDEGHKKEVSMIPKTTNDNATISSALLNIKALATSTPYKPQNEPSSVPEISCSSNNSTTAKDEKTSLNGENSFKPAPSNLDIPDVRIIFKRRRKAKGAAT